MMQSKIIIFCYAYIVGIVLAMLFPADPAFLIVLRVLTGLAFVIGVAFFLRRHLRRRSAPAGEKPPPARWDWLVLLIPALVLGYTRYISSNTVVDTGIGTIRIVQGAPILRQETPLPDTCRVRIRKTEALAADLTLRLHGELDARVAVTGEGGRPCSMRRGAGGSASRR